MNRGPERARKFTIIVFCLTEYGYPIGQRELFMLKGHKTAAPAAHEVFAHVGCPGPCAEISGRAVVGGTRPFCDAPASQNERERERNAPMPRKTIQKNLAYDTERQLYYAVFRQDGRRYIRDLL